MRWTLAEPAPDPALTRSFGCCLAGGRLAGPLRAYRTVASTQALAREWADAGVPEGAVVLADYQAAGRGQRGRSWTAPPGGALLFSVVLRPPVPVGRWPEIPLAAGCAVAEGLEDAAGVTVTLKWPNDALVEGRKVAGILTEGVAGRRPLVILGIGVNVSQRETDWPPELAGRASSLAEGGARVERAALLTLILARLEAWYGVWLADGFATVRTAWLRRGLLGARVTRPDGEGTAVDLGPGGELVIRQDDGRLAHMVASPEPWPEQAGAGAP
jgi:BirA family biotin operon repressor/biotin-[acetyl-CoA-carboxylase] ligase